jgi:tetratricopeptide (TPR) repeat protein
MSKKSTDHLFQLIKSLSKSEKRHFKLYSRRNSSGEDTLFLKLFDEIDKQKEYKEDQIIDRVTGISKRQYANIKSNLYRQLLASLRLLRRSQIASISTRELLDYAHILYNKGLYRQSLTILDRARSKALDANLNALALEIVTFEKMIESQHITRSISTKADELVSISMDLAKQVQGENRFSNLSLKLYDLCLKMGYARNEKEHEYAIHYFTSQMPIYVEDDLSFFEKLYLYQSYVWIFNITLEFPKLYRYAQKWVDLFHEYPEMIEHNIPFYLKGLHNLLNSLFLTLKYDKFNTTLQELISFNHSGEFVLTENEKSLHKLFTYIHKINQHYLEGSFTEGTEWIEELVELIEEGTYNWDAHRIMVFYYKIACLYFGCAKNEMAIEYLNKIINKVNPDFRADIQCFARILNTIAHFELGNNLLVSYQLKSVYRFLSKMEELNEMHKALLKFLRRTPKMDPKDMCREFESLKSELEVVQTHPFEKRSFLYLDLISWLESKIYERPIEEIIKEKYVFRLAGR